MARNTRFPGASEPLHIFQDDMFDAAGPMTSHAPMPSSAKSARAPLGSASSNSNVVLNPPHASSQFNFSPHKPKASSRSPLRTSNANKLKGVSMAPPRGQAPGTDSLQKRPFLSQFKTGSHKSTMDGSLDFGKENIHPHAGTAPSTADVTADTYYQNSNGKRCLMDAAPITESTSKRPKTAESVLPPPESFPPITDDGSKPPHSYATLIAMSILRSPNRRLTLSQIYKWIHSTYSFYGPADSGWQNSIRHNLSLNKAFVKTERPKDDPGKGNYWTIQPGTEMTFLKEKPTRKSAPTAENLPVMSTRLEPSGPTSTHASSHAQEPTLPPQVPVSYVPLPPLPTSQATMSMPAEPSSDATIPLSDNAPAEEQGDQAAQADFLLDASFYMSMQGAIHSSPPVPRRRGSHSGTPPSILKNRGSSAVRPPRRKAIPTDDSGYISSLESSAMRPNQSNPKANLLTSEADRPRIKRGRAEEEIIRMRVASSPFSPTKGRSRPGYTPASSSPLRQAHDNPVLHPGTPNLMMRPPVQPPITGSPYTSLRLHRNKVRNLLKTPIRDMPEERRWSPAFQLPDSDFVYDSALFPFSRFDPDIFEDLPELDDATFANISAATESGSPIKRSAQRPSAHRPQMARTASTSALGDNNNLSSRKPAAMIDLLKVPGVMPATETPSKAFEGLSSPSKMMSPAGHGSPSKVTGSLEIPVDGDWASLVFDPNEFLSRGNVGSSPMEEFSGLDMLQGFQRIGSGSQPPKPRGNKPQFGRSLTTQF